MRIIATNLSSKAKASVKRVKYIKSYVENMKANDLSNPRFSCILLNDLNEVMKYIIGDIQEKKLYNKEVKNYDQEIGDVLALMNQLVSDIDPKYYQSDLSEAAVECSKLLDKFAVLEVDISSIDKNREMIRNIVRLVLENIEGIKLSTDFLLNVRQFVRRRFLC